MSYGRCQEQSYAPAQYKSPTGYEPKHNSTFDTANYLKTKDSLIQVLPKWDYGGGRDKFRERLVEMLKSIQAVWLVENELRQTQDAPKEYSQKAKFFTPKRELLPKSAERSADEHTSALPGVEGLKGVQTLQPSPRYGTDSLDYPGGVLPNASFNGMHSSMSNAMRSLVSIGAPSGVMRAHAQTSDVMSESGVSTFSTQSSSSATAISSMRAGVQVILPDDP